MCGHKTCLRQGSRWLQGWGSHCRLPARVRVRVRAKARARVRATPQRSRLLPAMGWARHQACLLCVIRARITCGRWNQRVLNGCQRERERPSAAGAHVCKQLHRPQAPVCAAAPASKGVPADAAVSAPPRAQTHTTTRHAPAPSSCCSSLKNDPPAAAPSSSSSGSSSHSGTTHACQSHAHVGVALRAAARACRRGCAPAPPAPHRTRAVMLCSDGPGCGAAGCRGQQQRAEQRERSRASRRHARDAHCWAGQLKGRYW
jgi:hypothetical protein